MKVNNFKSRFVSLLIIAITLISCNSTKKLNSKNADDTTTVTSIEDVKWTLQTLEGEDVSDKFSAGQEVHFTLHKAENKISGFSGCNTFMGEYKLEAGNQISFTQLGMTRMACPDATVDETRILKIFENTDNYTIVNGILSLNKARMSPIALFKNTKSIDNPVTEKYWKLKILDGKSVTMGKNQEREIYFMLKTNNNSVTGFAGCNFISGNYSLEKGNRIQFSNMLATLKICSDDDFNEKAFLEIFELADNYTINGDVLSINVGRRAPLAVFEAVYFN